jgi:hypothetical protein
LLVRVQPGEHEQKGPHGRAFSSVCRTSVQALNDLDLPVIQGIVVFPVIAQIVLYLVGNLVGGALSKEWRRE